MLFFFKIFRFKGISVVGKVNAGAVGGRTNSVDRAVYRIYTILDLHTEERNEKETCFDGAAGCTAGGGLVCRV
jgi:hypothetical protein